MAENKLILVLNCGSSSLKYEILSMPNRVSLGKGLVERIGGEKGVLVQKCKGQKYVIEQKIDTHKMAIELVMKAITDKTNGIIKDISEISGIGHRVVHGGDKYSASVIIDDDVIKAIEDFIDLAPLHNPPNLAGIKVTRELMPNVKQVAVFDTAFHQTMPASAFLYGIPREFYDKYKIRRYGFHGTSHRYVSARALEITKRDASNTNIISCHLGNGGSVTAIAYGKSIDTSMGFTPLEGMVMGTRSGSIDPSIIGFLADKGLQGKDIIHILNKKSGLLGLSGVSNDMRDVEKAALDGNKNALQALDVFAYSIKKLIGAYSAVLDKVDLLVFTGGIGENDWRMREKICCGLENLGIYMNYELNEGLRGEEAIISQKYSSVSILVVPTNEELQIALDVYGLIFS